MLMIRTQQTRLGMLGQINPLLKLIVCLSVTIVALILHQLEAIGLLVSILLLLTLLTVRLSLKVWGYSAIVLIIGVAIATILRDENTALLSALRLIAIALPAPLLAGTTAPSDLVRALQAVRLPGFLVLSIMLIWRFLPLIQQEAQRIIEANQLRGVNLARQPRQWFSGLFLPLIFRIVSYADEVTIGLETRGYDPNAPRSNSRPLKWQSSDTYFTLGAAVLLCGIGYLEWNR
ncbi:energy-coupling factor transporter transmembrane protein EcfT [Cyanobacteria bacterium FACHB-DQ100]|nr:energy-coupling factor transporter transmembrane protein EcfT [Cyanobacteria bacterium FACHB-DQ100]